MKKTVVIMIVIAALALSLTGCGKAPAAQNTAPAAEAQTPAQETTPAAETPAVPAATQTESAAAPEAEAFPARADGERFEDVIMIEGMEETVRYEHVKSAAFGFEMDYDYENFVRRSDADCERFVSVWDNAAEPENYIEVRSDTGNAELVADAIIARLSGDYEIRQEYRELARAGQCIHIAADIIKGTDRMPDHLQYVYVIPAADGCRVVTEHCFAVDCEGLLRRFDYMLNTLTVPDGNGGETLSNEEALSAVRAYCLDADPELESIVNAGDQQVYWNIQSSTDSEIVVLFRSYTGALIRYYIDPVSGESYATEFVPGITSEEQRTEESFNARDFLFSIPGTWQTASVVSEEDGTAHPEYYVRFTDSEVLYGHMKDGAFVIDHTDSVSRFEKTAAGGFEVQAEAANGVQYTFRTSESDDTIMEYYETWNEADFPAMYRGGASLSRCS